MPLPEPKPDEGQQQFMRRCMGDPTAAAEFPDSDQRLAVCTTQFEGARYPGTNVGDHKPPQTVRDNYERGLRLHDEGQTGSGMEAQTVEVAKEIVAGKGVNDAWVRKADRWWDRNERFLSEDRDSAAFAAAMMWGGAAGRDWYRSTARQLEGNGKMAKAKTNAGKLDLTKPIRANIRTTVNSEMIRREQRDGRDVIVVRSATMPDDVVMNGILYPAAEIEKSYKTLEGTPAPLGHPMVNSMFVSASSPLGLNLGYFGAWNANVQRQNGRVLIEKVIDVERANESKMGRRVLAELEQGRPIHTSTGLTMNLRECRNSDLADYEGYDIEFDHDAILLDEEGAATPEQGVGMLVNSNGQQQQVVNSEVEERIDEHIDMLGMELLSAMDRKDAVSRWSRVKGAIMEAIGLVREDAATMRKEALNMAEDENKMNGDITKLSERMDKMEDRMNKMDEVLTNMGKKAEQMNSALDAINAEKASAKEALVNQAVEAKLLTKEVADATPAEALTAMLNAAKPKATPAPGVYGGFTGNASDDTMAAFSPLAAKKEG